MEINKIKKLHTLLKPIINYFNIQNKLEIGEYNDSEYDMLDKKLYENNVESKQNMKEINQIISEINRNMKLASNSVKNINYDIEWNLQEFREEQKELFDENGKRYTGVLLSNDTAKAMLKLINDIESALGECSKKNAALPIFDVIGSLPEFMAEFLKDTNKRSTINRGSYIEIAKDFIERWRQ